MFKCQEFGHIAAQMFEQDKNFDYWNSIGQWPEYLEEIVHDPKGDIWDDELIVDQATTLRYFLSMHPPSIDDVNGITHRLSVLKCLA